MKSVVFQNKNDIIAAPTAFSPASPKGKSSFPFLKTFWADKTVTCPRRTEHWNENKTSFSGSLENPGLYQAATITYLAHKCSHKNQELELHNTLFYIVHYLQVSQITESSSLMLTTRVFLARTAAVLAALGRIPHSQGTQGIADPPNSSSAAPHYLSLKACIKGQVWTRSFTAAVLKDKEYTGY